MVDIPTLPQKAYEYRNSTAMQKAFVTQARQHLESRYMYEIYDRDHFTHKFFISLSSSFSPPLLPDTLTTSRRWCFVTSPRLDWAVYQERDSWSRVT